MEINNELELIESLNNISPKDGLELIEKYENLIVKKYYEVTKKKIEFLIALNRYIDAKMLILNELNVPYIPREFEIFLHESDKLCNQNIQIKKEENTFDLDTIDSLSNEQLKVIIPTLSKYNLNSYIEKISKVLLNKEIYSYLKTLIIAVLSDNKIDMNMKVIKNDNIISFNPINVEDLRESSSFKYYKQEISKLVDVEINYIDDLDQIVNLILLDIYPEIVSQDEMDIIIAFAINYTNKINMANIIVPKYEKITLANAKKIDYYTKKINDLLKTI